MMELCMATDVDTGLPRFAFPRLKLRSSRAKVEHAFETRSDSRGSHRAVSYIRRVVSCMQTPTLLPSDIVMSASIFQINLTPTMGVTFIGLMLGAVFHGITTLQSIFYYSTYPKDKLVLKLLVAVLWILDTLSLIMFAYGLYRYLITDYMDPFALAYMDWSIASEPIFSGLIAFIVHEFLAYRIWILNRHWTALAASLAIFSLLPFSLALVAALKSVTGGERLWTSISGLRWIVITADVTTSVVDVVIASAICVQLARGRSGFAQTDRIIQSLTVYTINTGLLPTLVSIGGLIAYLVAPSSLVFEVFNILVSKAYTNTFLSTLNSRQTVRGIAMETVNASSAPPLAPIAFKVSKSALPSTNSTSSTDDVINLTSSRSAGSTSMDREQKYGVTVDIA